MRPENYKKVLGAIQGALARGRLPQDSRTDLMEAERILLGKAKL